MLEKAVIGYFPSHVQPNIYQGSRQIADGMLRGIGNTVRKPSSFRAQRLSTGKLTMIGPMVVTITNPSIGQKGSRLGGQAECITIGDSKGW